MTADEFQRQFHSRTVAYQPAYRADTRPVVVHIGDDAHSPAGHVLLAGLFNQLARAHQHIVVIGSLESPLLCSRPFGFATVRDASVGLAHAINPFITVGEDDRVGDALVTIALGQSPTEAVDLRVGCDGWCATFGPDGRIGTQPSSVLGAMLASCITAAFAFHSLLGRASLPGPRYSLWHYGAPDDGQGPAFEGPLDVGRVLQAGAGGVGASIDFWLGLTGVAGRWTVCDGDLVDVSNLNRQLAFLATHAGFPTNPPANKAKAAAALLGAHATPAGHWYGDTVEVVEAEYDVILALANEHGVRGALQHRQPPVLLHATTSPNWEAQLHRHVAGLDDCIGCRLAGPAPVLTCAKGQVDADVGTDAALPFLSGTAGVLLLAGLIRLQHCDLATGGRNFMSINLGDGDPVTRQLRRNCSWGCTSWADDRVRRHIASGTRYAALDPARRAA